MKRCSKPDVMREMQIKQGDTTTHDSNGQNPNTDTTKCSWGYEAAGAFHSLPVGMLKVTATLKDGLAVS
jgi:hypothetical protein